MKDKTLSRRLIYLDTEFVSRLYESEFNVSPQTQITRTQGLDASASIGFFSGGGNSSESRTYAVSSLGMLDELGKHLGKYPEFPDDHQMDAPSLYCWVSGVLGISKVRLTRTSHSITVFGKPDPQRNTKEEEIVGEEVFFSIDSSTAKFALSPTDQYFVSGIAALKGLTHVVVKRLSLPCRALIRVLSANTEFGEWIATPLVIYDRE